MTENYHIRLKENTAKRLVEKIILNMNTKATFKGRNATCQTILNENIRSMADFMIGKSKSLNFDISMINLRRNDYLGIQQRILTMTPARRKALGISKSGLWYQQKKIAEGKPIKVYKKYLKK